MINNEEIIEKSEIELQDIFKDIDKTSLFNQEKVLQAFKDNRVAARHFYGTTGYGYDDGGRDNLGEVFAHIFKGEKAIVSPLIASGTHAISLALYGILRPNDCMLSICGMLYDTLEPVLLGNNIGSLKDFGIHFLKSDLIDGLFNYEDIKQKIMKHRPKVVFIQRSRGYSWRNAFCISQLKEVITFVKKLLPETIVMVDNCYGEFVEKEEPLEIGADIIMGSLIKNPGGGLAPTGGYIIGKKTLIELIGYRLTAPGVGLEVGSYAYGYQLFYQGVFMAPHVTAQALKGAFLFGAVFEKLGYKTLPKLHDTVSDIIRSIEFNTEQELIQFCQAIQAASPVDSFVTPYPWEMPGYSHQVIMAAGVFNQGASIELSADSPIKAPYIAYLQGGLTYEHVKIAVKSCMQAIKDSNK